MSITPQNKQHKMHRSAFITCLFYFINIDITSLPPRYEIPQSELTRDPFAYVPGIIAKLWKTAIDKIHKAVYSFARFSTKEKNHHKTVVL